MSRSGSAAGRAAPLRSGRGGGYSHEVGPVAVQDGAEGQPVAERRGHVGDAHVPVALALLPAPLLQRLDSRHARCARPGRSRCREAERPGPSCRSRTVSPRASRPPDRPRPSADRSRPTGPRPHTAHAEPAPLPATDSAPPTPTSVPPAAARGMGSARPGVRSSGPPVPRVASGVPFISTPPRYSPTRNRGDVQRRPLYRRGNRGLSRSRS